MGITLYYLFYKGLLMVIGLAVVQKQYKNDCAHFEIFHPGLNMLKSVEKMPGKKV